MTPVREWPKMKERVQMYEDDVLNGDGTDLCDGKGLYHGHPSQRLVKKMVETQQCCLSA